jgi:hypothetical protein
VTAREHNDLFLNLAEQVKQPFVQIAHAAELLENPSLGFKSRETIAVTSKAALQLIDGYLLSVELQRENQLNLEPVSLSSVLYDTAEVLHDFAQAHACNLELHFSGKYGPVMAHKRAVQAALINLGLSFIEALSHGDGTKPVVTLAVRRHKYGISTGVYSDGQGLSSQLLKRARILQASSHQPLSEFESGMGTSIFIADTLFSRIHSTMKVAHFQGLSGLAATLKPSLQMSLV